MHVHPGGVQVNERAVQGTEGEVRATPGQRKGATDWTETGVWQPRLHVWKESPGEDGDCLPLFSQVQEAYELLEKEKLYLEHEVSLLRAGSNGDYDLDRQRVLLEVTREQLHQAEERVEELESFIIVQVC